MQNKKNNPLTRSILILLALCMLLTQFLTGCSSSHDNKTFVDINGKLKVIGNQLCNQKKEPIQLKGMSSHSIHVFGSFVNVDAIRHLRDDWGMTLFRAAMYTEEGGYIKNPDIKKKVQEAVQAAIDTGIYIIIDWHILSDGDPNKHKTQAIEFFNEMATLYGKYPNVIYEICNEPNGKEVTWSDSIKPYADEVIAEIRKIDPDNIIIVGTDTWSQGIDAVEKAPLDYSNIMYALHFYAGTHEQWLRDRIDYCLGKNIPVFVSEWGTSLATGSDGVYSTETLEWINFLDERKISWVNWSLSDKPESSAALLPSASSKGGWTDSDLSESGLLIKYLMKGEKEAPFFCEGFESMLFTSGGWDANGAMILQDKVAPSGDYVAILKNNNTITKSKSTKGYKNIKLELTYNSNNLKNSDSFIIEWFDGKNWSVLKEIRENNEWVAKEYDIPEASANNPDFAIRFTASLSDPKSKVSLDEIKLIGEKTLEK
ncbi:MAG: Endoglucanase 5A [Firmicutes bacterium ADurb.Bin419]|nr:MAG: Endoglucanase 5A [Firmicutes bacterium ADurb.Bin419]